ncbi:hypothetical protein ACH3XW_5470 [Acanthocheilonema viteae]
MGIHNLLPFVKNACRQGNISEFAHQSIAVDVSCLLHRGLIGCADKVAQGCETDFYIHYVSKYVKALLTIGCHVILVFDGQMLPAKKETNSSRREKRDFHKQRGDLLMSEGRASEAYDCFKRSASLTPKVIENTIQAFRRLNMVDVIVAPYESDAQLMFLTKTKMAQAVVTEDSDLIAFGCEKIIFKMDPTGSCVIFDQNLLPKCLCRALAENFDFDKFRRICILSGCDYLQAGLPGVGLNKAAAFFAKTSDKNLNQVLPRLPRYLNKNSLKVSKQFISDFIRAENTFLYQIIFDPVEKRQRPLNEYPLHQQSGKDDNEFNSSSQGSDDHFSYAGSIQPPEIAMSLALGNIPGSSQTEQIILPENVPDWSIWSPNYKNAEMRQKEKCNEETRKKSSCGILTIESSRPPPLRISNSLPTIDSKILTSSSTSDNDDFVSSERTRDLHKKLLVETSKTNQILTKIGYKLSPVHSIGVTRSGNGARRNWNCDHLLKEFTTATNMLQKNSANSYHEIPVKKSRKAAEDDHINQSNHVDDHIIPVTSSEASRSSISCSKYFLNKGSKTSGLLRRSLSSRVVPSISQTELSQTDSDGSQDILEKANSDMPDERFHIDRQEERVLSPTFFEWKSEGFKICKAGHSIDCIDSDMYCFTWIAENSTKCDLINEFPNSHCKKSCQLCNSDLTPKEYDLKKIPVTLKSIAFLIGKWRSEFGGKAVFPTIPTFTYGEEIDFKLITKGDRVLDVLNYTARAWDNWDGKEMHAEYGFLSVVNNNGTDLISLNTVMSNGFIIIEEGEEHDLSIELRMRRIGRITFSHDLPVLRMSRIWTLLDATHLEARLSISTVNHREIMEHTSIIYDRIYP